VNSFLETLKQLGPARIAIMGSVLLGLMVFFVFVSLRVSTAEMSLLYTDLSTMDASAMAAKLEEMKIPYEVSQDGSRITVADTEVGRARMLLAEAGLPNGGSMGYELFDKQAVSAQPMPYKISTPFARWKANFQEPSARLTRYAAPASIWCFPNVNSSPAKTAPPRPAWP